MSESGKTDLDLVRKKSQAESLLSQLNEIADAIEELTKSDELHSNESQLREISKTIANLEQMKIAVPDELRKLKVTLTGKVNDTVEVQKLLKFIDDELRRLQTKVQGGLSALSYTSKGSTERRRRSDHNGRVKRPRESERGKIIRSFWEGLLARAGEKTQLHSGLKPGDHHWISAGSGLRGLTYGYIILQHQAAVSLYIDRGEVQGNKRIFDELHSHRKEIEQSFGQALNWQRLDKKRASRVDFTLDIGGYMDEETKWPAVQEALTTAMVNFEKAISPFIAKLKNSERHRAEN